MDSYNWKKSNIFNMTGSVFWNNVIAPFSGKFLLHSSKTAGSSLKAHSSLQFMIQEEEKIFPFSSRNVQGSFYD